MDLKWGERRPDKAKDLVLIDLYQVESDTEITPDSKVIAKFSHSKKGSTAIVDGQEWKLDAQQKGNSTAELANGKKFVAAPLGGKIARAKEVDLDFGNRSLTIENTSGQDYVVETAGGDKVAQYTGAGRGVRQVVIELESNDLTRDERVFLAWVARVQLEARLVSSTWIWTVFLLLLLPFMIGYFLL